MDTVELAHVEKFLELGPGTWTRIISTERLTEEGGSVWIACVFCGTRASLEDHTIRPDGIVRPSLVCPGGCGWHVYARLVGWEE